MPNAIVALALVYGGLTQWVAGIFEFVCGNTFGYVYLLLELIDLAAQADALTLICSYSHPSATFSAVAFMTFGSFWLSEHTSRLCHHQASNIADLSRFDLHTFSTLVSFQVTVFF